MGRTAGEYILGIDSSTSGTKACLWTLEGELAASGSSPHSVQRPHPGWAEQDASWDQALIKALEQLFKRPASSLYG